YDPCAGNRAARRNNSRRACRAAEKAAAGVQGVSGALPRHPGEHGPTSLQAVHRADTLRAAAALPALPEGRRPAARRAESRSQPRRASRRGIRATVRAMAARTRQASEIGQQRSSARAVSLAAGGAARTAFRPGAEDLRAGFGQAAVEDVANYSALTFSASAGLYESATQCPCRGVRA